MSPFAATRLRTFSEKSCHPPVRRSRPSSSRFSSVCLMLAPWSSSQSRASRSCAKSLTVYQSNVDEGGPATICTDWSNLCPSAFTSYPNSTQSLTMSRDGGAFFSRYRLKSAPCSSRHRMSDRSDMRKVQDVASFWSNTLVVKSSCTRAISFSLHALSSSRWSLLMIGLGQVQWRYAKWTRHRRLEVMHPGQTSRVTT
jgi:hypothetical protein